MATCPESGLASDRGVRANSCDFKRLGRWVRELPYWMATANQGEHVTEIKVRNAAHSEFSFSSAEEFKEVVESGGITAEWEVYHSTAKRWLPITRHPVFAALNR